MLVVSFGGFIHGDVASFVIIISILGFEPGFPAIFRDIYKIYRGAVWGKAFWTAVGHASAQKSVYASNKKGTARVYYPYSQSS